MTLQITAAYNFVPLAEKVVYPEWQDLVSHDLPLQDGLCAELDVELTAHTPLLVGGQQRKATSSAPGEVSFHRLPDGRYAIPGSSIRGMLRNVVEIASHARLGSLMDDRALSLRDLSVVDNDYMRNLVDAKGYRSPDTGASPKAKSGWLWFDGSNWRVQKAGSIRVQQDEIKRHFGLDDTTWPAYGDQQRRKSWRPDAHEKRKILLNAHARKKHTATLDNGHLMVRFENQRAQPQRHGSGYLNYACIKTLLGPEDKSPSGKAATGALVCTGQPGPSKHMEFVFTPCTRNPASLTVKPHVMAAFHQVHADDSGDWKRLWESLSAQGTPVPVFFLMDADQQIERMGLAQMFRLPGKHTLGELADKHQKLQHERLDFAQTLFGHVRTDLPALKGRISVGDFTPVAGTVCKLAEARFQEPTVLSSPKPGFYPSYFKQDLQKTNKKFSTILSDVAPHLRGWKRYPVHALNEVAVTQPPPKSGPSVQIRLQPLASGCKFSGVIRLHNVRPQELGALLWALDFGQPATSPGEAPALRHALGLGKPFGFGQVSLRLISPPSIRANDAATAAPTVAEAIEAFERFMTENVANWKSSDTLRELRAMANPQHPGANRRNLTPPQDPKAFVTFKKNESAVALRPYSQIR